MSDLFSSPLLVLDTETTGFRSADVALELGAVLLDCDGTEIAWYQSLVRHPTITAERLDTAPEALGVNLLTHEEMLAAPTVSQVLEDWVRWLGEVQAREVTAYNADFDRRMLRQTSLSCDRLSWGACVMRQAVDHVDARGHRGQKKAPKLTECIDALGLVLGEIAGPVAGLRHRKTSGAHTALWDARMAGRVAVAVAERVRG